jgi:RND family efflux transporter MFP subunit
VTGERPTGEPGAPDRRALLSSLRIERATASEARRPRHGWLLWLAGALMLTDSGLVLVGIPGPAEVAPHRSAVDTDRAAPEPRPSAGVGERRPAGESDATSVLDASGYVVARRQATVSAKVTGRVTEVFFEEGIAVQEGQLLARLDGSVLAAEVELAEARLALSRAAVAELEVSEDQARLDFERASQLAERGWTSQADLDRHRLAVERVEAQRLRVVREVAVARRDLDVRRRQLEDLDVRAPFAGIIVARTAQVGEIVSPMSAGGGFTRTGICSIVDMGSLEVEVDVNEAYIQRVRPRQSVTVHLNAYPGHPIPAEVLAVIPTVDRNRGTVRVRISLLVPEDRVLPDMGVRVGFLPTE